MEHVLAHSTKVKAPGAETPEALGWFEFVLLARNKEPAVQDEGYPL